MIKFFAIVFILWEVYKMIKGKMIWNFVKNDWFKRSDKTVKTNVLHIISYAYIVYVICLFFTHWWIVGLFLIILACVTALLMFPYIKVNATYYSRIMIIDVIDTVVSILLLSTILW